MAAVMVRDPLFAALEACEDAIRLGPPIRAAGEFLCSLRAEQPVIGEVSDPCLALGRAFRRPGREPGLAYGLRHLAHFFGTPPAVFDHALEIIGPLLLPIDAGIGFLQ